MTKKIFSFFILLFLLVATFSNGNLTKAKETFTDSGSFSWAEDAIYFLHDRGVISGYGNGKFGPGDNITREQAALMLVRELYPNEKSSTKLSFSDVDENSIYYNAIAVAVDHGIFGGYPDRTFKPGNTITRAETAKILSVAYGIKGENASFSDVNKSYWAFNYINALASNNIIIGYPDYTFKPDNSISRAEFSSILARVLDDRFKPISCSVNPNESVNIPDKEFEALIRNDLRKTTGDITVKDMCSIDELSLSFFIKDISGIEYAKNLTSLYIIGRQISDIGALSGLTRLNTLHIRETQISDISALSRLTNLTSLDLTNNPIGDISALSRLTNLTVLNLNNNPISDISALSGLTNLTFLSIDNNPYKIWDDSTPISDWIDSTPISDINALSGLTNLTFLDLDSNQISDINALSGLTNLTSLNLGSNPISDISALSGLTNLTSLNLGGGGNQTSDISALSGLTNLTSLSLANSQISDISALSELTSLVGLNLTNNQIGDISALSGLTNLEFIYLSNNQISDISPLKGLSGQHSLWDIVLANNQISDISVLSSLSGVTKIYFLNLSNNQISNISALSELTNIRTLWLKDYELDLESNKIIENLRESGVIVN